MAAGASGEVFAFLDVLGNHERFTNRGTYQLSDNGTGTRVRFELEALAMPWCERPLAPLTLRWVQRANDRALVRLGEVLASRA